MAKVIDMAKGAGRDLDDLEKAGPLGRLRDDLVIVPRPTGTQVAYRVSSSTREFEFQFYEVEYAVAKSLDGKRGVDEVVKAVRAAGFSVSREQVQAFYRELKGMGFLLEGPEAAAPPSAARGTATDHSSDAAQFIKQGLAFLADGKAEFARSNLEAALELDPESVVAKEGLEECERVEKTQGGKKSRGRMIAIISAAVGPVVVLIFVGLYHLFVLRPEMQRRNDLIAANAGKKPTAPSEPVVRPNEPAKTSAAQAPDLIAPVDKVERLVVAKLLSPGPVRIDKYLVKEDAPVAAGTEVVMVTTQVRRAVADGEAPPSDKLKQLEALAAQEEEYRIFLERERKNVKGTKRGGRGGGGGPMHLTLASPSAGLFAPLIALKTSIRRGDVIAEIRDATGLRLWARFRSKAVTRWFGCALENGGTTVPCALEEITQQQEGVEVVASVRADGLTSEKGLRLRLRPDAGADHRP